MNYIISSSDKVDFTIVGKSSKFFITFSNKMLVIKAGILKILVRISNREDPDQNRG